jgi:hypothetical protein
VLALRQKLTKPAGLAAVIDDRRHVADQLVELANRLDALADWTRAPGEPFPADATELGEFMGQVAVLLLAGGGAAGDGPSGPHDCV